MRKKYVLTSLGTKEKFWDKNWRDIDIKEAVRFCEIDPLCRIFDKYFLRRGKILEAGCGLGRYVIYYRKKGYGIEGVDTSRETIEKILRYDKTLPVQVADVTELPYPDNYFKTYYSGGVVEHFEEGPDKALKEAHRVLMPDGILIITVPYFNPFRRFNSFWTLPFKNNIQIDADGKRVKYIFTKETEKKDSPFPGYTFHEYYYRQDEFASFLQKNGFRIIYTQGISLSWGLKDIFLFKALLNPLPKERQPKSVKVDKKYTFPKAFKKYIKKIIIGEKSDRFLEKAFFLLVQRIFSSLILFVCKVENKDSN